EVMIQRAVDELSVAAARDDGVNHVVRALLMQEGAGEEVFRGVARSLFIGETGPLASAHLASESSLGWSWNADLASAVTLHLGAGVQDAPPAKGVGEHAAPVWEQMGAAVARAVGTMVEVDGETVHRQNTVAQWLLRGAVGTPEVSSLHPLEAVIAWRLAELAGAVVHVEELSRLQALVDGVLPREEELESPRDIPDVVPAVSLGDGRPGRRELVDAVALHIILGAPRSRKHPAFGVGPLPLWRRSVR
ncbi:MAG: hypothetical protein VX938_00270, partial [Myxococcota bacterium]|nr:hypothetical protein [Myxococcota bacterium]